MKIYIGSDHAGFELKGKIIKFLSDLNYEVADQGAYELNANDDYPDFVLPVAEGVAGNLGSFGIVIGGTGQGEAICANKTAGIRAIVFYGPHNAVKAVDVEGRQSDDSFEIIRLGREHNNANVLSLSARFLTDDEAKHAVLLFLETKFGRDVRHVRRIEKLEK